MVSEKLLHGDKRSYSSEILSVWKAEGYKLGVHSLVVEGPHTCELHGFYSSPTYIHTPLHEAWLRSMW